MQLIRGLANLKPAHKGCVATIGNFDGVHLGHQAILQQLSAKAHQYQAPSVVITFQPHPQEYFQGSSAPIRLMSLREKLLALKTQKIDQMLCIHFNQAFSQIPAKTFVEGILVNKLGIKHLLVGDDFKFGYKRQGDFELLTQMSQHFDFTLEDTKTFTIQDKRVSSSAIREHLKNNDLTQAAAFLGRPYQINGVITRGHQKGRSFGFPTANIALNHRKTLLHGIYVVKVFIEGFEQPFYGAASVGNRPTVDGKNYFLEVFIFDFNQNIYGKRMSVDFLHYLRPEAHYESIDLLKAQMAKDIEQAKQFLLK